MSVDDAFPAFHYRPGRRRDLLILCDHASNRIPPALGGLGLDAAARASHIAWDPGAAGIARQLAERLRCPAFFGAASRLLVDLNRAPDAADLIVAHNDGRAVPGNVDLDAAARAQRLDIHFHPYHAAITRHLDACARRGRSPILIAIHTFSPEMDGQRRPWPIGLVWKQADPANQRLLDWFRAGGIDIGDNQPYGANAMGYTLNRHGIGRGLRHLMFEVRQDLVSEAGGQRDWARRILAALRAAGIGRPA